MDHVYQNDLQRKRNNIFEVIMRQLFRFITPLQVIVYLAMIAFTWKTIPFSYVLIMIMFTHVTSLTCRHHFEIAELERKFKEKDE